jgi:hypothetical protein
LTQEPQPQIELKLKDHIIVLGVDGLWGIPKEECLPISINLVDRTSLFNKKFNDEYDITGSMILQLFDAAAKAVGPAYNNLLRT